MDVVGAFGYVGQDLFFIDNERFAHTTSKGIYIYDTIKGPREILWRQDKDVLHCSVNVESQYLVFSFKGPELPIELVKLTDTSNPIYVPNPHNCPMVQVEFSSATDRLFGLSDVMDHRLTIWAINGKDNVKILASEPLDHIFTKIIVNPCENSHAILYGIDGVYHAVLHELFDEFTLKITKVFPLENEGSEKIAFCAWLPFNRLLSAFENGDIYEINLETKKATNLGRFYDPALIKGSSFNGEVIPTCLLLTLPYLIIGTHDGSVYWYPVGELLKEYNAANPPLPNPFFAQPARVLKLAKAITSIAMDPTFSIVVIGTVNGSIVKANIESETAELDSPDNPELDSPAKKVVCEGVTGEFIGNDCIGGLVLTSKFLSIGIKKLSSRVKTNMDTLVLGTHDGIISIWRDLNAASINLPGEAISSSSGIRRSVPRAMKELIRIPLLSKSGICSIETVCFCGHYILLCIGTESGYIEYWTLNATENEEDDTREPTKTSTNIVKLLEDEEATSVIKFEANFLFKTQIFTSAISSQTLLIDDNADVKLVLASNQEPHIFILHVLKNGRLELGKVYMNIDTKSNGIHSLLWFEESLYTFISETSSILRHIISTPASTMSALTGNDDRNNANPTINTQNLKFSSCGPLESIVLSPSHCSGVAINNQGIAYFLSFPEDIQIKILFEKIQTRKLIEHKDLVSLAAFAPNGNLFTTCSIDGSIYIWRIERETNCDIVLINTVELNCAAIVSLAFSPNSNYIFTSSLDGGCYTLSIAKTMMSKMTSTLTAGAGSKLSNWNKLLGVNVEEISESAVVLTQEAMTNNTNNMLLSEKLLIENEKEMKVNYKFKCMGISAAIDEIKQRLEVLIKQNNDRGEIEQLPSHEFVIDLKQKDQIEKQNTTQQQALFAQYNLRKQWLDCLAARLRMETYDKLEAYSYKVRPFRNSPDIEPSESILDGVSSFSIRKLTSEENVILEKAKRLRRLEIRVMKAEGNEVDGNPLKNMNIRRIKGISQYRCGWSLNVHGCPADISYIVNDGIQWPTPDYTALLELLNHNSNVTAALAGDAKDKDNKDAAPAGGKPGATNAKDGNKDKDGKDKAGKESSPSKKKDGEDKDAKGLKENGEEEEEEDDTAFLLDYDSLEQNLENIVYAPQTTRSEVQKRNQIIFYQQIIKQYKEKFNTQCTSLLQEKEDIITNIASKNTRILEICTELNYSDNLKLKYVYSPALNIDEHPARQLEVFPHEMIAQPYENEAMRQQKLKEEQDRKAKEQTNEETVVRQRALDDMMHGTLEVKRDILTEVLAMAKPSWMDELHPSEMNEQQVKEFDAYQNKLKVLQEEQLHYKKQIEQELKKLIVEINEICHKFNERIDNLLKTKILLLKLIYSYEIYMTSIGVSIIQTQYHNQQIQKLSQVILQTNASYDDYLQKNQIYNKQLEELKSQLTVIQEEEKTMDKTFRRDLQNLSNNANNANNNPSNGAPNAAHHTFDQESLKAFYDLYHLRNYPKEHLKYGFHDNGDNQTANPNTNSYMNASESNDISNSQSNAINSSGRHSSSRRMNSSVTSGSNRNSGLRSSRANNATGGVRNSSTITGSKKPGGGGARGLRSSVNVNQSSTNQNGSNPTSIKNNLGPMQQAAAALRNVNENQISYEDKNPFYQNINKLLYKKLLKESQLPIMNTLTIDHDCPEGIVVDQYIWSKLNELRIQRIRKEIEVKLLSQKIHDNKHTLTVFESLEQQEASKIQGLTKDLSQHLQDLQICSENLMILISLLQGQNEVDKDAITTEYSTANLLPNEVLYKYNHRIKELGNEKINILSKIKLFRRKINTIDWDAKHQSLEAKHFETYYTDIQLFRVTRDLQKVILEGENAFNQKERCDKINQRKEYLSKDYNKRNIDLITKLQSIQKLIMDKEQEIDNLTDHIDHLQHQVKYSQSIKKSREHAVTGQFQTKGTLSQNQTATMNDSDEIVYDENDHHDSALASYQQLINKQRMHRIVSRRRMVDLARTQAEEIDMLRQELDRMRQKTFPSFVKATKKRVGAN